MKQIFTFLLLCLSLIAYAQPPVNDDCSGLIDLGEAPICDETVFYSNVDATPSDIGFGNIPTCWNGGTVQNDVWFAFQTSDTIFDYTITVTGLTDGTGSEPLQNPQIALYRGDCEVDGLAELDCIASENGDTELSLDAIGLTPSITYFIRINDFSATAAPNWGTFNLCVEEIEPINTIDEDGSTACSGELYDSGGPDGDYENNEDNVFSICPSDFSNCITFTLEYYNIEPSDFFPTDQLVFYDGPEPNPATVIAQIGGSDFNFDADGGGGVCYEVQAASGCLTVQFITDGTNTFEGFAGAWECSAEPCEINQPITVEGGITEEQIIDFISTPLTTVEITDINCPDVAYGIFEAGDNTDLGLEKGLLLTSGTIDWAIGPNNDGGGGNFFSNNNAPGDADLDYLSEQGGSTDISNDACVIELDVFAATNELVFEYVFASEEYPEFVNQFNDIFAFFISGPGIVGDPNIDNQQNIAVLPNGLNTQVEIDAVNNLVNWEYYRNNVNGQSIQYDGLTSDFLGVKKSLTARAEVLPCSTYHLKLAVADRVDNVWDSGVFISELRGGTPNLSITFNSGIDYLIEDCTNQPDELVISLSSALDEAVTYAISIGGTAELGVDYVLSLPDSITFQPGETEFSFPITVLSDLLEEDTEIIQIALSNDFGCGDVTFEALEVELRDVLAVDILTGQDTVLVCQDSSVVLNVDGASTYFWTPVTVFEDPSSPTPLVTTDESLWVFVEGNVGPCSDIDSIFIQLIDPEIEISTTDPTEICQGDSIQLVVTNNVNDAGLQWFPEEGLSDPTSNMPIADPQFSTTYVASVNNFGCIVSDTIEITVDAFDFPELINDTTICQNSSVVLASFIDTLFSTTTYAWTPTTGLDDPTLPNPTATPDVTTTYELIGTSATEACADTAEVTITVLPADVDIQGDTIFICDGEVATLEAITSTGTADGLTWTPNDGTLSDTTGLTVIANPEETQTYFASFEIGICSVIDSVVVRIDSIPSETAIMVDPEDDPYCAGEILTLSSTTYEPSFFPDIEHLWTPSTGQQSPDSLWNLVITTVETETYIRITTNNACTDTSEILINVVEPPILSIIPPDTVLCEGESVQLIVENAVPELEEIMWSPEVPCGDCFDPVVSPSASTTYSFSAEFMGCPVGASGVVNIVNLPVVGINTDQTICPGETVLLNTNSDPFSTYEWSSPDDPNFSSNVPELEVAPGTTTTYVLTATNNCGTIEEQITVTVVGAGSLELIDDQFICEGDELTLTAVGMAENATVENYTWLWPNGSSEGPVFSEILPTTSVVTLTYAYGTNNQICGILNENFQVNVSPAPGLAFPAPPEICLGESIVLNTDPDPVNTTYSWSSPDDPNFSTTDAAPTVSPTQNTVYMVTAETPGCPIVEEELMILVVPDVTMMLPDDIVVCVGDPVTINPIIEPAGDFLEIFNWTLNGNSIGSSEQLTIDQASESGTIQLDYTYGPDCGTEIDSLALSVEDAVTIDSLVADPPIPANDEVAQGVTITFTVFVQEDIPGLSYQWTANGEPIEGATGDSYTVQVIEEGAVTYGVTVTTAAGCEVSVEETIIGVPPILDVPNAFTPDNDGDNDFFNIVNNGEIAQVLEFKIYNRWGQLVYDNEDPDNGWDGTFNDKEQPSEVYIYNISVERLDGEVFSWQGDVTLIR